MPLKNRFVSVALALTISMLFIVLTGSVNSSRSEISEAQHYKRNAAASAVYARLAILPAPPSTSDITLTLHNFVRNNEYVNGATLFDDNGRLVAQMGEGNDTLSSHLTGSNTAKISIRHDGQLHGYAVLAFRRSDTQMDRASHYFALLVLSIMLAALVCGVMAFHNRLTILLFNR